MDLWFDKKGVDLDDDAFFHKTKTWERYMHDGTISSKEIDEQQKLIFKKLKAVEKLLSAEAHKAMTDVLVEYGVLITMYKSALGMLAKAAKMFEEK